MQTNLRWVKATDRKKLDKRDYQFIKVGDRIKIYDKETKVLGFYFTYNEGTEKWETIILTEGRGDPLERSLDVIELCQDSYTWKTEETPSAASSLPGEIEEIAEALMKLRVKSVNGRVDEKDLYDVQIMLYKLMDTASLPSYNQTGVWQLCPKCNGDGNLARYNSPNISIDACPPCDVCNGSKILLAPSSLPASNVEPEGTIVHPTVQDALLAAERDRLNYNNKTRVVSAPGNFNPGYRK